jgi:hypothetical protein
MPSLTGTLLADAHDLDVLAGTTAGNFPFEAFYIEGIDVGIPVSDVAPADPQFWIRGTRWDVIKGRPWTPIGVGAPWSQVRVQ